jgi:hypothetical protein
MEVIKTILDVNEKKQIQKDGRFGRQKLMDLKQTVKKIHIIDILRRHKSIS